MISLIKKYILLREKNFPLFFRTIIFITISHDRFLSPIVYNVGHNFKRKIQKDLTKVERRKSRTSSGKPRRFA